MNGITLKKIFILVIFLLVKQDILYSMQHTSENKYHMRSRKKNKRSQKLVGKKKFEKQIEEPINVFTKKEKKQPLTIETKNHLQDHKLDHLQDRLIQRILAEISIQEHNSLPSNNIVIQEYYPVHDSFFLEWTEK